MNNLSANQLWKLSLTDKPFADWIKDEKYDWIKSGSKNSELDFYNKKWNPDYQNLVDDNFIKQQNQVSGSISNTKTVVTILVIIAGVALSVWAYKKYNK